MSNGHAGASFLVVMGSNGIPSLLTNPLHYINPFFLENVTVAKKMVLFLAKKTAVPDSDGWGLVINGSCNGCQWKLH